MAILLNFPQKIQYALEHGSKLNVTFISSVSRFSNLWGPDPCAPNRKSGWNGEVSDHIHKFLLHHFARLLSTWKGKRHFNFKQNSHQKRSSRLPKVQWSWVKENWYLTRRGTRGIWNEWFQILRIEALFHVVDQSWGECTVCSSVMEHNESQWTHFHHKKTNPEVRAEHCYRGRMCGASEAT